MTAAEARRITDSSVDANTKETLRDVYERIEIAANNSKCSVDVWSDCALILERVAQALTRDGYKVQITANPDCLYFSW